MLTRVQKKNTIYDSLRKQCTQVLMLHENSLKPTHIRKDTLCVQRKFGKVIVYWAQGNKNMEQSLPESEILDILQQLPQAGEISKNKNLINNIVSKYNYTTAKIILLGDSGIGAKSSLLLRFADDTYTDSYHTTIGVDFKIKFIEYDTLRFKLEIWDTAGQEQFRDATFSYYKDTSVAIIGYDVTDRNSFVHLEDDWIPLLRKYASEYTPFLLVGNKKDLINEREVTFDEAAALAKKYGAHYLECSAKTGENVKEIFYTAVSLACPTILFNHMENYMAIRLTDNDCMILASQLKEMTDIKRFNISRGTFTKKGISALALALKNHPTLAELDVSHNSIGNGSFLSNSGLEVLFEALRENRILTSINVSSTNMNDRDANSLISMLSHHPNIKHVTIEGNSSVSASRIRAINEMLKPDSRITPSLSHFEVDDKTLKKETGNRLAGDAMNVAVISERYHNTAAQGNLDTLRALKVHSFFSQTKPQPEVDLHTESEETSHLTAQATIPQQHYT